MAPECALLAITVLSIGMPEPIRLIIADPTEAGMSVY